VNIMERHVTPLEAGAALQTVEGSRQRVIEEIDLPTWYRWSLALGWIALGFIADLGHAWLTTAATFVFGTVHAAVAPRVISGRHRSDRLSVSRDLVDPRLPALVIGGLIVLAGVTIAGAIAAEADGAGHPVTIASMFVAVIIVLGGPRLLSIVRRRAARRPAD
jgi:hypothetical protein